MVSLNLYENLPLNAQMIDAQTGGMLRHICESVQPFWDDTYLILRGMPEFLDPDLIPGEYLDWFGQWVGLAALENGTWQGVGINPCWPDAHKRDVIKRASHYWLAKGTEWGVREAVELWLQWDQGHNPDRLLITLPFGKVPQNTPPLWHGWGEPYNSHINKSFPAIARFGHSSTGGYPEHFTFEYPTWQWQWGRKWADRHVVRKRGEWQRNDPAMGPRRPWMHFNLGQDDITAQWNHIFANVHLLNLEIWSAWTHLTTVGWMNLSVNAPLEQSENDPRVEVIREAFIDGFTWADSPNAIARSWPKLHHCETPDPDVTLPPDDLIIGEYGPPPEELIHPDDLFPCCDICSLGVEFEVSSENITAEEDNNTEPNQLAEFVAGGFDVESRCLHPVDLGLPSVDNLPQIEETLPAVDVDFDPLFMGSTADGYRWVKPIHIARWGHIYGQSYNWFVNDLPTETLTQTEDENDSSVTTGRACNIWGTWGPPRIQFTETEIIHEESTLNLEETYPQLTTILKGDNWAFWVETNTTTYRAKPATMRWKNPDGEASQAFSVENFFTRLELEFLVKLTPEENILALWVQLDLEQVIAKRFIPTLASPGLFGLRLEVDYTPQDVVQLITEDRPILYADVETPLQDGETYLYESEKPILVEAP